MARRRRVHRAVAKVADAPPRPTSPDEARLIATQMKLTDAHRKVDDLTARRDEIALRLWLVANVPQLEIARLLDQADRSAGGPGVTYARTQKFMHRSRERSEELEAVG